MRSARLCHLSVNRKGAIQPHAPEGRGRWGSPAGKMYPFSCSVFLVRFAAPITGATSPVHASRCRARFGRWTRDFDVPSGYHEKEQNANIWAELFLRNSRVVAPAQSCTDGLPASRQREEIHSIPKFLNRWHSAYKVSVELTVMFPGRSCSSHNILFSRDIRSWHGNCMFGINDIFVRKVTNPCC